MMIVEIDMHIRDERLLDFFQHHNNQRIPAHTIASLFKCHTQTVAAMVNRLEQAGKIQVIRSRRGGHVYRVVSCKK